jgi:uncharacterized protein YciI
MAYFALVYHVVDDYLVRRAEHRAEHLELARAAHARGELVLAGAFAEPTDGALLVWHCAERAPIEAFVAADPYVRHGLVVRWEIRGWTVVIGADDDPAQARRC